MVSFYRRFLKASASLNNIPLANSFFDTRHCFNVAQNKYWSKNIIDVFELQNSNYVYHPQSHSIPF
jgi:hypothetical protein